MNIERSRVGLIVTHPIQYYAPWYRALAQVVDLEVYYCHRQSSADQARTEFGVSFEWDVPLLDGYRSSFLTNCSSQPDVSSFGGCDTPEIATVIREQHFDAFIVPGWYARSYWQAMIACWRSNTPLLVRGDSHLTTPRTLLKRLFKAVAYRGFIPRFDGYLVVGERNRRYYSYYGADTRRMFFAPHAVDNQFFSRCAYEARPERQRLREAWGLPSDAIVFVFVGKLAAHKQPHDFLKAIELANRAMPNVWGLIVGDGPQRTDLAAYASSRSVAVRFTGFLNQSEMPQAYAASNALVLTSHETWGLVVNEAMASGLPALVSDVAGCVTDLVLMGQTGAIFRYGDVEHLSKLMTTLANDPFSLSNMGTQAARHIQRYSVPMAVDGTLAALRALRTWKS